MFANLIESASHQQDLARKGRFFLATLISYALIVACASLASIYAFDAHLEENQDLEFLGLVPPIVPDATTPEARHAAPRSSSNNRQRDAIAQRTEAIDRIAAPTKIPDSISANGLSVPEIPKSGVFVIGPANIDASIGGPDTEGAQGGDGTIGPAVAMGTTPPPIREQPANPPQPTIIHRSVVLNGDATFLPKPPYPPLAITARVQGQVSVQVIIDESGKIVSARASSGNPMLTSAAVGAAFHARFNPTKLNGVPVKVSGIINYNFSLQ